MRRTKLIAEYDRDFNRESTLIVAMLVSAVLLMALGFYAGWTAHEGQIDGCRASQIEAATAQMDTRNEVSAEEGR